MPNIFHPKHPERICWGCDRYCPADDLSCGNGTIRTPHPIELLGEHWCSDASEDALMLSLRNRCTSSGTCDLSRVSSNATEVACPLTSDSQFT
jgi:hypothetical protein